MTGLQMAGWLIGALSLLGGLLCLRAPERVKQWMIKFPRSRTPGRVLVTVDLVWSALLIHAMYLGAFDQAKPLLWVLTPLLIFLCIRYMDELLSPRALGGLLLLAAGPLLNLARFHPTPMDPTPWRLVITTLCYVWIVYGLWLLCAPYTFRRLNTWWLRRDPQLRAAGVMKLAFGIALIIISTLFYGA